MGDYGIKVARAGYSVTDSERYMALQSGVNIFKVKADGSGTLAASGSTNIVHGVSSQPHFLVFMEDTNGKMRIACGNDFDAEEFFKVYADTTNVTIENNDSANSKDYYYYIHYDPQ